MRQKIESNHRIDGLQNCTRLVELYLHSNKIRYIKNISHLKDLKVLWLANNNIHQIEGLGDCTQLKELNLAKNPINKLGDILSIKSLEKLNVAATNIGSFKVNHFYI
jgi:protein phosphatase 1 regulatory subunit 7